MKKSLLFKRTCIAVSLLTITCFTACSGNKDKISINETEVKSSSEPTDTTNETEAPMPTETDLIVSDDANKTAKPDSTSKDNDLDATSNEEETIVTKNNKTIFKDHLNTAEYVVKKDGTYSIKCEPNKEKAYWDIYVLDEKFDDALRYLTAAYQPKLKATDKSQQIKLKKGQYVYGMCSINAFTGGDSTNKDFKCSLTIEFIK